MQYMYESIKYWSCEIIIDYQNKNIFQKYFHTWSCMDIQSLFTLCL